VEHRAGLIPLRVVAVLAAALLALLAWWTWRSSASDTVDGRIPIVFWGSQELGEDIYTVINRFELKNPQYRVIMGTAVARDLTGDAQRLLSAITGGVPPDVVWFDRFAVGEWAGRGALEDLTPYLEHQRPDDPYRIDLGQYYPWAVEEGSYRRPGSQAPARVYGVPATFDIRVLYSNADLLRQEGLVDAKGEPKPPATWEELRDYGKRLSRFKDPHDPASGMTRLGFAPGSLNGLGNSWLYMYAWQAGGELMDPGRTRVTMDAPPVVRALRFMTDLYDDLGGIGQVDAYQQSFQSGALDPYLRGHIALKIDGDWSLADIADWKPDMDFIVSPAPIPADRLASGAHPITWAGGWALVMPATAKRKEGAFKLIQYLRSWEACQLLEQGKREQRHSRGRLYMPSGNANRVFYERLVGEAIDANPAIPPRFKQAYRVLEEMMDYTLIRPVTPVGQLLWNQQVRAFEGAVHHKYPGSGDEPARAALVDNQRDVQRQLDRILSPPAGRPVSWQPYFWAYGVLLALPFAAMWWAYRTRRRRFGWKAREIGAALFFASPWLIGFAVLVGGPIAFSIVMSFTAYDVLSPATYAGLGNYQEVFDDQLFYKSLANTGYMVLRIPLGMIISLAIAMLLNRSLRGIGFYRTAFYLPSIMPLVAASLLWIWLFNPNFGAFNAVLGLFTANPPNWLWDEDWSKPSLIIMNLWTAGGGMIIWLAGLQSIPVHLYEAAKVDGASAWQRFWNITLPMLSPYILFNLIMGLIGTMQIFGEAYIMTAGGPADSTLFYAYHLFKQAFQFFRMGYASALAWILFVVVLALTLLQLWLSRKWVNYDQA
jgi:multiple sugar transport system permease protein